MGSTELSIAPVRGCPSDDTLAALITGDLSDSELSDLYAHADDCEQCRELLVGLARVQRVARDADAPTEAPTRSERRGLDHQHEIQPGTRIDHYCITSVIGEGGMGRVFKAEDESLARRVAIKVVLTRAESADSQLTVRLVREAQAMAQLSHPNVLTVYGVGTHGADVYFAMEYVDGETLGEWVARRKRPWRQILQTFIKAGRGLSAAHAAGLVHRDFKPHNVLVSSTGRVLVTDFGLVAQVDDDPLRVSDSSTQSWDTELTQTGMVLGTPAYMAPEAIRAGESDARSDQFSFCVALTEALCGAHPFDRNVRAAAISGRWEPRLHGRHLPARLRRVLLRGLRRSPDERFADMNELLAEIDKVDRARRRRKILAAAAAVVAVAAGFAAWAGASVGTEPTVVRPPCPESPEATVAGAWEPDKRRRIRERVGSDRVIEPLDNYAKQWQLMAQEACEATRVRGEVSEDMLDARMVCLDSRRRSLGATAGVLAEDTATVAQALEMIGNLPALEPCANLKLLRYLDRPSPDPSKRTEIDALERQIWRAHALGLSGSVDEARRILDEALPRIDALEHKPLQAEARRILALVGTDDRQRAEALMREAYQLAMVAHADDMAANISLSLAQRAAYDRSDPSEGQLWLDLATSHGERGALDLEWELEYMAGAIARARGDHEEAAKRFASAAAQGERLGLSDELLAVAYGNAGASYLEIGLGEEAAEPLRKAIALNTQAFGPDDSRTLSMELNAAALHIRTGDHERAERELNVVLERIRSALGDEHPFVASTLMEFGALLRAMDRAQDARDADAEAHRIRAAAFGDRSPKAAQALRALAADDRMLGQRKRALSQLEAAASIFEEELGADHVETREAREELAALR